MLTSSSSHEVFFVADTKQLEEGDLVADMYDSGEHLVVDMFESAGVPDAGVT